MINKIELPSVDYFYQQENGELWSYDTGCGCCASPEPVNGADLSEYIEQLEESLQHLKALQKKEV